MRGAPSWDAPCATPVAAVGGAGGHEDAQSPHGQRRGRTIWMLVTACVTLSGPLSCPGARQAEGYPTVV